MHLLEITSDRRAFTSLPVRRKGDQVVYVTGETKRQTRAVRKLLMALARRFGLPMIAFAEFAGVEKLNAANEDLIDCLSIVPNPYPSGLRWSEAELETAKRAWMRDWKICNRVLAQDPTIEELLAVSGNQQDWCNWWRCNHPDASVRARMAQGIAEAQALINENRRAT
jgi:hypothetical protein